MVGPVMSRQRARVFWSGRSQAVRLPKEFRFEGDTVLVRREGTAVILEPARDWPADYVKLHEVGCPTNSHGRAGHDADHIALAHQSFLQ